MPLWRDLHRGFRLLSAGLSARDRQQIRQLHPFLVERLADNDAVQIGPAFFYFGKSDQSK
jgi:hypothetical protein